jgi:hypothetical protein
MTDGYNNTYDSTEVGEATIDVTVSVLAQLFQFSALIAVILIGRWLFKKVS